MIASANMIEAGCADVMGNATATAVEMLATVDGQEKLAAMFNTCQVCLALGGGQSITAIVSAVLIECNCR